MICHSVSCKVRETVFGVSDKVSLKPTCTGIEEGLKLEILDLTTGRIVKTKMLFTKNLYNMHEEQDDRLFSNKVATWLASTKYKGNEHNTKTENNWCLYSLEDHMEDWQLC